MQGLKSYSQLFDKRKRDRIVTWDESHLSSPLINEAHSVIRHLANMN